MQTTNPFKALGLPLSATSADVKAAFRRLSRETHPDRNPDADGADFRAVREAYEAIRTDAARERERRRHAPTVDTGRDLWHAAKAAEPSPFGAPPDPSTYPRVRTVMEDGTLVMEARTPPPGWTPGTVPPPRAGCIYHFNGSDADRAAGFLEYGVWAVGILPIMFVFGPPPPTA